MATRTKPTHAADTPAEARPVGPGSPPIGLREPFRTTVRVTLADLESMTAPGINLGTAADALGVSRATASRAVADGTLPSLKLAGRLMVLRVPLINLIRYGSIEAPVRD